MEEDEGYSYRTPENVPVDIPIVDEEYEALVTAHVEKNVGPVDDLFHPIISPYVHADILIVPPGGKRRFTTLVTCGMGARRMNVPPGERGRSRMELALCLPPDWPPLMPAAGGGMDPGPGAWIVPPMQSYARMPFEFDTWFGDGHTIPNGDPPEAIADESALCCAMITRPRRLGGDFHRMDLPNGEQVHFWMLTFITKEEMKYKLRRGAAALRRKLVENKVTEILDLERSSVCRGGLWGLFS